MKGYICLDEEIRGFKDWEHFQAFLGLLKLSDRFESAEPIGKYHPGVEQRMQWFKRIVDASIWSLAPPDPPARGSWLNESE